MEHRHDSCGHDIMKLEHSFEVAAGPDAAWAMFMDVPRVVSCMPGAELVETIDESTWKARLRVKLGPVGLTFDTDVHRTVLDLAHRQMNLSATGQDSRGRGRAEGTLALAFGATPNGTRVAMVTEVLLAGAVAQFGSGLVQGVSNQLVASFASCLQAQLAADPNDRDSIAFAKEALVRQEQAVSGAAVAKAAIGGFVKRRTGRER